MSDRLVPGAIVMIKRHGLAHATGPIGEIIEVGRFEGHILYQVLFRDGPPRTSRTFWFHAHECAVLYE